MVNKSILKKVDYLLNLSINKKYTNEDLNNIIAFTSEHSDNLIIGKVFGYSISEYAFATLKWINDAATLKTYERLIKNVSLNERLKIKELVDSNLYLQY